MTFKDYLNDNYGLLILLFIITFVIVNWFAYQDKNAPYDLHAYTNDIIISGKVIEPIITINESREIIPPNIKYFYDTLYIYVLQADKSNYKIVSKKKIIPDTLFRKDEIVFYIYKL